MIGHEKRAVGVDADAVGRSKSGGENVRPRAVLAHAEQGPMLRNHRRQAVARGLGVIEIAVRVGLQIHRELVEMLGDLMVAVEAFVKIDLAVAVEIDAGLDDLIATADEDRAGDDLQSQAAETIPTRSVARSVRRRAARRIPRPARRRRPTCKPRRLAVEGEVEPGRPDQGRPRIFQRQGQVVDRERAAVVDQFGRFRLEFLGPTFWTSSRQRSKVFGRAGFAGESIDPR